MKLASRPGPQQMSSGIRLVDCHAHLEELEEPEAAIHRAGESGVAFIVGVGMDLERKKPLWVDCRSSL